MDKDNYTNLNLKNKNLQFSMQCQPEYYNVENFGVMQEIMRAANCYNIQHQSERFYMPHLMQKSVNSSVSTQTEIQWNNGTTSAITTPYPPNQAYNGMEYYFYHSQIPPWSMMLHEHYLLVPIRSPVSIESEFQVFYPPVGFERQTLDTLSALPMDTRAVHTNILMQRGWTPLAGSHTHICETFDCDVGNNKLNETLLVIQSKQEATTESYKTDKTINFISEIENNDREPIIFAKKSNFRNEEYRICAKKIDSVTTQNINNSLKNKPILTYSDVVRNLAKEYPLQNSKNKEDNLKQLNNGTPLNQIKARNRNTQKLIQKVQIQNHLLNDKQLNKMTRATAVKLFKDDKIEQNNVENQIKYEQSKRKRRGNEIPADQQQELNLIDKKEHIIKTSQDSKIPTEKSSSIMSNNKKQFDMQKDNKDKDNKDNKDNKKSTNNNNKTIKTQNLKQITKKTNNKDIKGKNTHCKTKIQIPIQQSVQLLIDNDSLLEIESNKSAEVTPEKTVVEECASANVKINKTDCQSNKQQQRKKRKRQQRRSKNANRNYSSNDNLISQSFKKICNKVYDVSIWVFNFIFPLVWFIFNYFVKWFHLF